MKNIYKLNILLIFLSIILIVEYIFFKGRKVGLYFLFYMSYLISLINFKYKLKLLLDYKIERKFDILEISVMSLIILQEILFIVDIIKRVIYNNQLFSMYMLVTFAFITQILKHEINYISGCNIIICDNIVNLDDIETIKYKSRIFNRVKVDIILNNKQIFHDVRINKLDYSKLQ